MLSPTLARRWHFRAMDDSSHGLTRHDIVRLAHDVDLFLNVSGSCLLRDEYMPCRNKVLIDTDPGWNHFVNYPKWDASPGWLGTRGYRAHDHFFTYAERIGSKDCVLPTFGIDWKPTRPLVLCDAWRPRGPGTTWTTVMTWNNFRKPVEHDGVVYGTKEREFGRIQALPSRTSVPFEVAVGGDAPIERWRSLGWRVVDSHDVSRTADDYRTYVEQSRGEFSVAKNLYVATRSGWFSCRSVCYLAAGRPVVLQDTGFSEVIPTGEGVLAFSELKDAVECVETVEADYDRHQRAAREVARTHFGCNVVLGQLLARIGLA
jgi:hypothetical protein